ncbi:MAG: extracellular solute-binding protein [Clostridia bacterium]|nr:extracellular solute-binding protein [Clostridia bacterium]
MKHLRWILITLALLTVLLSAVACGDKKETVMIYTSTEDYNLEHMQKCLNEQFPQYNVTVEYMSTSDIAAKIIGEGASSDCDIVYMEEYAYLEKMIAAGVLDSIKGDYDLTKYTEDVVPASVRDYVLPCIRQGGGIIVNTYVLEQRGLAKPTKYEDLLDSSYKGLISMPSPKSSGTGYMFYYQLVRAWGEEKALDYFNKLTDNILAYTTSGSGPVNALINREAAVGFGMICQAVTKYNEGNTELEVLFFDEGAPYNLYGNSIVKGKKERTAVKEVMDYLESFYTEEACRLYYPEVIITGSDYQIPNFPKNIAYADMAGNNLEAKEHLLSVWTH